MKSRILLFLGISAMLLSCSRDDEQTDANLTDGVNFTGSQQVSAIERRLSLDEKSLFKEIFFGRAATSELSHVNDLIAVKSNLEESEIAEVNRVENLILSNIDGLDSSFFASFNANITSGDHLLVQQTLKDGGVMLEKALLSTPEIAEEVMLGKELAEKINIQDFTNADGTLNQARLNEHINSRHQEFAALCGPTFCFAAVVIVVAQTVAAAVNYAGAVNVYVWFNVFRWVNGPKKQAQEVLAESELQEEIMIDEIVTHYGV
ncbi:hypothetical protein [Ascidiimonas aurantiaca]|uniref:hypothetical protein n=1 Tax=Ascidiimonas aurantiaca TaxID=1685432 RepID=UPI0030ECEDEE